MKRKQGFSGSPSRKEPTCRRRKRRGFDPWVGKMPGMAIHFSILAWRAPGTEEPGRPQSLGSQSVGHELKQRSTLVRDKAGKKQCGEAEWKGDLVG